MQVLMQMLMQSHLCLLHAAAQPQSQPLSSSL